MKISSRNILLTLLVIGTFIVCALMVFVYLELRATPAQTAQRYQEQQQQQIEMLSPDSSASSVYRDASAVAQNTHNTATEDKDNNILKNDVLTSGNVEKKNNKKAEQTDANLVPENAVLVERELKPTNVNQETAPSGNSNRELVAVEEKKERAVKPTHKENKKANQAIDELF